MSNKWPKLKQAPVMVAIIEIRYDSPNEIDMAFIKKSDSTIRKEFPNRRENLSGNINMPTPIIGEGTVRFTSKHEGFTYTTNDKERTIDIGKNRIGYTFHGEYNSWDSFKNDAIYYFDLFSFLLNTVKISRISIRFINDIKLKEINDPTEYFNTFISAKEDSIEYPVDSFSFRYSMAIDKKTKVNVAHSLEEKIDKNDIHDYILDIDVLSFVENFNLTDLSQKLDELRNIKNDIFFKTLTKKMQDLL